MCRVLNTMNSFASVIGSQSPYVNMAIVTFFAIITVKCIPITIRLIPAFSISRRTIAIPRTYTVPSCHLIANGAVSVRRSKSRDSGQEHRENQEETKYSFHVKKPPILRVMGNVLQGNNIGTNDSDYIINKSLKPNLA